MKKTAYEKSIAQLHRTEYETSPDVIVSAPGCVRILGEHTIAGSGMLMAFPLDRRISVAVSGRRDASIRFFASDLNERKRTNMSNLKYKREDRWANFVKSALAAFCTEGGKGFNVTVCGDIPQGLGLGSATALQCAAARAASLAAGLDRSPSVLAQDIVAADASYFGRSTVPAAYLPTLAAEEGRFIVVDSLPGSFELLPSPLGDSRIYLTDSRVPRPPLDGELEQRRQDCIAGLELMNGDQRRTLRDYGMDELDEFMGSIPERIRRHCAFFVEEVARVAEAREAVRSADLAALAKLLNKSQAGLRNSYEISCPEIDWLVKRAAEIEGVSACRMIGRGFGGCTLTIARSEAHEEYRAKLEEYERIFGFKPSALEISVGAGMIAE